MQENLGLTLEKFNGENNTPETFSSISHKSNGLPLSYDS